MLSCHLEWLAQKQNQGTVQEAESALIDIFPLTHVNSAHYFGQAL